MPQPDSPQTIPARTGSRLKKALIPALAVLLGALLALFLIVMFFNPESVLRLFGLSVNMRDGTSGKYNLLRFLGVAMGGVILAIQAANSHRRAKALEETAKAQADAAKRQAEANRNAEKGLRQERLKNAIEHLGSESASVRLGGAYELFHLAEDTEGLRRTIFDILCAHIRRTTGEAEYRRLCASKPSEEIQNLLTLLFVQEHEVFKGLRVDLRGSWLNGATLRDARLQGANLYEARLQGAVLEGARLQGANLYEARLQGAVLEGARLQGASLYNARLQGACLGGACLQGANLEEAQLQGANLHETELQGAFLRGVHLEGISSIVQHEVLGFAERIRTRIGQESDLVLVHLAGGHPAGELKEEESIDGHWEGVAKYLANSGAETGAYSKEQAEEWIAEYEAAMVEFPKEDAG